MFTMARYLSKKLQNGQIKWKNVIHSKVFSRYATLIAKDLKGNGYVIKNDEVRREVKD